MGEVTSAGGLAEPRLLQVMSRSLELGFLGNADIEAQVDHARGFARVINGIPDGSVVADLGAGGGLPGLVLACEWQGARFSLIESSQRRARFLEEAVEQLGLRERASVVQTRAEDAARAGGMRAGFDLVVARSFGTPAVTVECGSPLLRVGGRMVVSDPPGGSGDQRWPESAVAALGLGICPPTPDRYSYRVLLRKLPCPDRFPRRVGVPSKRPLF